jgi:hypothetical protein
MSGRLLMDFHLNLLYGFVHVRFPSYIRQLIQSAQYSLIERFRVDDDAMFRIVGVLQPDNAFADRHVNDGLAEEGELILLLFPQIPKHFDCTRSLLRKIDP